jgi:hypothetical protein
MRRLLFGHTRAIKTAAVAATVAAAISRFHVVARTTMASSFVGEIFLFSAAAAPR